MIIVSLQVPFLDSETSILSLDWNIDLDLDLTWTWSLTISQSKLGQIAHVGGVLKMSEPADSKSM